MGAGREWSMYTCGPAAHRGAAESPDVERGLKLRRTEKGPNAFWQLRPLLGIPENRRLRVSNTYWEFKTTRTLCSFHTLHKVNVVVIFSVSGSDRGTGPGLDDPDGVLPAAV